jgi:hypothetical protein
MPRHNWQDFACRSRKARTPGTIRKTKGDLMADKDRPLYTVKVWVTLAGTELSKKCGFQGEYWYCCWGKFGREMVGVEDRQTGKIIMTGPRA